MGEMAAFVKEFVVESREILDQFEHDLIELESHPSSQVTLASIFRAAHTLKGAASFMGLPRLQGLAHSGESVLSRLRQGSLALNPDIANRLLALADCIRRMLAQVDETGEEGDIDCAALVEQLTRLHEGAAIENSPPIQTPPEPHEPAPDQGELNRSASRTSVRVNVEHLDHLMNLVGELVLARNEIIQFASAERKSVLLGTSQLLNSITTQLQEGIMKTRMQPIDTVWSKMPRVARDAAQYCGKRVRLEMDGRETELDRTLIEAIHDPLTHVIRNCIDHGLETPEARIAAGKAAEGCISLRASHEGGQVTIEVSDDGAGIDVGAIRRKAQESGLIAPEQARAMSDQEVINLIFLPGLSTAATVTSMSGRGVGMDVVKTNIEQIGGKVSIQSQAGVGTTLRMRIPLTLAIMTSLVITSGQDSYAIPQINVLELVRLEDASRKTEMVCDVAVYRLRGELLPLVRLDDLLAPGRPTHPAAGDDVPRAVYIVVLQADGAKFGLIVDEVNDTQEIVVKPLGRQVRGIPLFAGATITGNGRVVLILDIPAVAVRANVLSEVRDKIDVRSDVALEPAPEPTEALLLFAGPDETPMAIPLSQITRLEEFPRASLEHLGNGDVVQYFDDILPLADIASLLGRRRAREQAPAGADKETLPALVYSRDGRQLGVVVDRIVDTTEVRLSQLRPTTGRGTMGSMVIDGRVTEVLNLNALCANVMSSVTPERAFTAAVA